ncbi:MAG: branched-chain amino acid transporter [Paenibacillaceae bacterium]|jgi:branched-subunit amino acid transport protein|nr:branched-chain amino acid transporter [Paenibacillaceae bacterium]
MRWDVVAVIMAASAVTVIPRVLPLSFLSRVSIPEWGMRWLRHIPVAVMAALLAQSLFMADGKVEFNPFTLLSAIPAFIAAFATRSLLFTVVAGIGTMLVLMRLG